MCTDQQETLYHPGSTYPSTVRIRRKKLWQLKTHFHCSVIGTCLSLDELRRICRKTGLVIELSINDFELHRGFVDIAAEDCPTSRRLHKHLDRKYKRAIESFAKVRTTDAIHLLWKDATKEGDVAGAYWALVTHPWTPTELLEQVYGEVHMLSHLASASTRTDIQEFDQLRQRVQDLENNLAETKADNHRRLSEKNDLLRALHESQRHTQEAEKQLAELRSQLKYFENDSLINRLQTATEALSARLSGSQRRALRAEAIADERKQMMTRLEASNERLRHRLSIAYREKAALEAMMNQQIGTNRSEVHSEHQCRDCPHMDLCGRWVLYVGGRSGQWEQFRALVERQNGRFLYHDGGREDSRQRLASILCRADAVLCPLDCVSHDAVNRVKRFCHRFAKPLILLPRASLSAFARGLVELAA